MSIQITTPAFAPGAPMPQKFTGEGDDVSPALSWTGVPSAARELAMIVEDPDAPRPVPFIHWVIYKLPPDTTSLPEGVPNSPTLTTPAGAMQGRNDFPGAGYRGPLPPKGHGVHHYHFRLYALDAALPVKPGFSADELRAAMKGHVIAEGEVVGTYER